MSQTIQNNNANTNRNCTDYTQPQSSQSRSPTPSNLPHSPSLRTRSPSSSTSNNAHSPIHDASAFFSHNAVNQESWLSYDEHVAHHDDGTPLFISTEEYLSEGSTAAEKSSSEGSTAAEESFSEDSTSTDGSLSEDSTSTDELLSEDSASTDESLSEHSSDLEQDPFLRNALQDLSRREELQRQLEQITGELALLRQSRANPNALILIKKEIEQIQQTLNEMDTARSHSNVTVRT